MEATPKPNTIKTHDGIEVAPGEQAYDFYADVLDDTAVVTLEAILPTYGSSEPPWAEWVAAEGVTTAGGLLDGSRVCSLAYARRQGWLSTPEPRTWRSMSDLHIDITEALEYLVGRFGTLNEKDIQGVAEYLGIDLDLVQGVAEEMGVSS